MKRLYIFCILLLFTACQKENISISTNASEVFYVENQGASMRVFVEGNTASHIFILIIHGGPGVSSYFYDTKYISNHLGDKYAMVYWDQRNAGASQGTSNGKYLHLGIMVEDLKKVIEVLKFRYGDDMSLFLVGHSFGGLVAADFVTTPGYQQMIKGLIDVDGSHNYPLNDTLTREMLLSYGAREILLKRKENKWIPIVNYCLTHQGNFSEDESMQLEKFAGDAENLVDSVKKVNLTSFIVRYSITDVYPLTAILSNLLYSEDSNFNKELAVTQFSSSLNTVTIPVLVLWGKYDFVCPLLLGEDFYNRIQSTNKRFVISPVSGHNMILQDKRLFCDEISAFVSKYR
jgi:pimeloyl-ACP methyl ester carboxylesterase